MVHPRPQSASGGQQSAEALVNSVSCAYSDSGLGTHAKSLGTSVFTFQPDSAAARKVQHSTRQPHVPQQRSHTGIAAERSVLEGSSSRPPAAGGPFDAALTSHLATSQLAGDLKLPLSDLRMLGSMREAIGQLQQRLLHEPLDLRYAMHNSTTL